VENAGKSTVFHTAVPGRGKGGNLAFFCAMC